MEEYLKKGPTSRWENGKKNGLIVKLDWLFETKLSCWVSSTPWIPLRYLMGTSCVPHGYLLGTWLVIWRKRKGRKLRRPLCVTREAFCNPIITGSSGPPPPCHRLFFTFLWSFFGSFFWSLFLYWPPPLPPPCQRFFIVILSLPLLLLVLFYWPFFHGSFFICLFDYIGPLHCRLPVTKIAKEKT